jgi:hypothetical protein
MAVCLTQLSPDFLCGELSPAMVGKAFASQSLGAEAVHFPGLAQETATTAVLGTLALVVRHFTTS